MGSIPARRANIMLECLIVGDSIATGIAQHRPECVMVAKVGITSKTWNQKYSPQPSKHTIISLGTNDWGGINTFQELYVLRSKITGRVTWILPVEPSRQTLVLQVAQSFADSSLIIQQRSRDGIHPTTQEYRELAKYAQ